MVTLAEELKTYFPNDGERSQFAQAVSTDLQNSSYHLYCEMYDLIHMLLIYRYLVTGRKPAKK